MDNQDELDSLDLDSEAAELEERKDNEEEKMEPQYTEWPGGLADYTQELNVQNPDDLADERRSEE